MSALRPDAANRAGLQHGCFVPNSEVTSITRSETRNRDCEPGVTFVRFSNVGIRGEPGNPPQQRWTRPLLTPWYQSKTDN
jgi:hypothetical protein